jgi:hypothetical protein
MRRWVTLAAICGAASLVAEAQDQPPSAVPPAGTGQTQSPSPGIYEPANPAANFGPGPARPPTEVTPGTSTAPAPAAPVVPAGLPTSPPILPSMGPTVMTHAQKIPKGAPDPKDPRSWLWEYSMKGFTDQDYAGAVRDLIADFEKRTGQKLAPGAKRRVGIKVMTSVQGLSTPVGLVRGVISALEARGYKREEMFIIDQSESRLRAAGFLPPPGMNLEYQFEGVPVLVMDRGIYYDTKWNYDSPLPAPDALIQANVRQQNAWTLKTTDRLSLLPVPLLLGVDFWINLPVGVDQPSLGLMGTLANASVLASSNTARFLQSSATGAVAVAEISAIPELLRGWVFSILSLEQYQYMGGPLYNSLYTDSEPTLMLSANPVILDYLLYLRMNRGRTNDNLPTMDQPAFLDYAKQLDLGDFQPGRMYLVRMPK